MNQRRPPLTSSPLIDPSVCSVVLLTPSQHDMRSIGCQIANGLRRNFFAILSAAHILDVPVFLVSPGPKPGKHGFAKHLPTYPHREFFAGKHAFPWQDPVFIEAVTREDKAVLILAGFWLEHQVLATALHALADSYDVYVLLDAAPARDRCAARLSQDRLIQAGATPVVTSQVFHEWSAQTADPSRRASLSRLLASALNTGSD